ncbi:30S ribosomal protein S4 [Candidatus Azambacteria bacterium RIFCSPLOWO2_01_FULL_37_9]|uniref:Small ribosomal subunit protein uS4 n=1 Tax=Candidatus Azambacteria bacterium RIFCSPLOWO2_01_FULL_37_9 TaxID=1797297 RepID=A0A1F5C5U0_9BACT|nr:MAG: 30S ribosomal protein S4 [Candidatus Azambacteria bacterium RIFCSPLOWO2_01_FULL_37_9]
MKIDQKCKICRRAGEKLFLKGDRCFSQKCAMVRNATKPGVHGKSRSNLSEFGIQLREKQKARFAYNLSEKQFKNYVTKISQKRGTGDALISKLERRLDNVVYRLGFAGSRSIANQAVGHGHFYINGRKMDIPSYEARIGDVIEIRPNSKNSAAFKDLKETLKKYNPPSWLSLDKENLKGEMKSLPAKEDLAVPFNLNLIIEYYSR